MMNLVPLWCLVSIFIPAFITYDAAGCACSCFICSEALLENKYMEVWINGLILIMFSIGHAELWITFLNRTHALPVHEPSLKKTRHITYVMLLGFPIVLFVAVGLYSPGVLRGGEWSQLAFWWKPVLILCSLGFLGFLVSVFRHLVYRVPRRQSESHSEMIDIRERLGHELIGDGPYHYLAGLPFNEIFSVEFSHKTFVMDRLPTAWEGLKILHLSDLHFSGTLTRDYFCELCRIGRESKPDLIIFSGDLVDQMHCLDWLDETLGQLEAPLGRYFILGNHDWNQLSEQIRTSLSGLGWIDVSSQTIQLEHAGHSLLIAGTEVPWMGQHPELPAQVGEESADFQLLVSHTPDNYYWACSQGYDLVLAGHTHGGQVRLPFIGPVFAPSVHGTRYTSGTFYRKSTLMHVSRGVSGIHPLRFLCRPEFSLLTLLTGR
ncbi:MAG TPA: hypothetical protein DCY03_19550 [Planctomycetaceae bacterium]|nr:hypothetical protein [Planctomycetaceae bacterium]|tara:strand:+ start:5503 stop:6801 length:1299 start_codon:yes stop_codon:yes gene_type:complete